MIKVNMNKTKHKKLHDMTVLFERSKVEKAKAANTVSISLNGSSSSMSSDLIRVVNNENGQQYVLNGKWVRAALESKYSSKFSNGKLRFVPSEEIKFYFPDMRSFDLETLNLELAESLYPKGMTPRYATGKNFLKEFSQYDYPYVCRFGKVKVLAKEKVEDIKTKVLKYITDCHNTIQEFIEGNINLLYGELRAQPNIVNYEPESNFLLPKKKVCTQSSRSFSGTTLHEEYIMEIDKFVMNVYNREGQLQNREGQLQETLWMRYIIDNLGNEGVKTVAALLIRRLIGFCKV